MNNQKLNQIKENIVENKLAFGLVFVAAAVFIVLAFINKTPQTPVKIVEGCKAGDTFSQTTGEPCKDIVQESCKDGDLYDIKTGKPCVGAVDPNTTNTTGSSYDVALKTYTDKTLLFDDQCNTTPKTLDVVMGSKVLLANNSQTSLALSIQGKNAVLKPYHYMTSLSLSVAGEVSVSCNGNNVSTVNVK